MNKSLLTAIILSLSLAFTLAGCGGESEPPPDQKGNTQKGAPNVKPGSILSQIPVGSSYFMTGSVDKTIGSAEMFLIDIGVGKMLNIGVSRPGDGRGPRSELLDMIKKELKLGEGFDSKGGAAFVVLDPKTVGLDLVKLMDLSQTKSAEPAGPPPASNPEDMIAIIAPGRVETLFADAKPTKEGDLTVLKPNRKKIYAAQKGTYAVISPSSAAVKAIVAAGTGKNAASELSKDELVMINSSDIAMHVNVAPYRPVVKKLLDGFKEQLKTQFDPATAMGFNVYLMMGEALVDQLDATTLGVKMGQNGLNIDSICTAKSGSTMAKVFAAESDSAGGTKLFDSIPSLPYVLAMGIDGWMDNAAMQAASMDFSKAFMGAGSPFKLDEKDLAAMEAMQAKVADQITSAQMSIGAAPAGKGMVSLAYVIHCKDSAKYRAIFPESITLTNKMMSAAQTQPNAPKVSMTYAKDAEKVGDLSVDALTISLTGMPGAKPDELSGIFKMIFGEETIRMLVATPDAKTLVMTLGGTTETLKETLKVAAGKGPIPAMPGTVQAMRNLPKNSSIVMLFNTANLMDVIRTGMKKAGATPEDIEIIPTLKCKTPIAFGAKAKGAALHTGFFAAKAMIAEAVQAGMKAYASARQGAMENRQRALERQREIERQMKEAEGAKSKP